MIYPLLWLDSHRIKLKTSLTYIAAISNSQPTFMHSFN